jgi:hypothetical protein
MTIAESFATFVLLEVDISFVAEIIAEHITDFVIVSVVKLVAIVDPL